MTGKIFRSCFLVGLAVMHRAFRGGDGLPV